MATGCRLRRVTSCNQRAHPVSSTLVKFIRKLILVETSSLTLAQKDILYNKINEIGQDFHFMKFNVISTGELSFPPLILDKKQEVEEIVETVKKVISSDVALSHGRCILLETLQNH